MLTLLFSTVREQQALPLPHPPFPAPALPPPRLPTYYCRLPHPWTLRYGRANLKTCNRTIHNPGNSHNARSERDIRRRVATFRSDKLHPVISTYRRFLCNSRLRRRISLDAKANLQKQHDFMVKYLAAAAFRHHGWWQFSLGNFRRVENERQSPVNVSIPSENRQSKHKLARFWYRYANTPSPCRPVHF